MEINIEKIIDDFCHPKFRLICICDNFVPYSQEMEWHRCKNCGGWLSKFIIISKKIKLDKFHNN